MSASNGSHSSRSRAAALLNKAVGGQSPQLIQLGDLGWILFVKLSGLGINFVGEERKESGQRSPVKKQSLRGKSGTCMADSVRSFVFRVLSPNNNHSL